MKAEGSAFWRGQRRGALKETAKESMMASRKGGSPVARGYTDELVGDVLARLQCSPYYRDEASLSKLRQLGMSTSDEAKLVAMRDYINKLAGAISRCGSRPLRTKSF
jgi:phosphoinositide-3-kinase regulatory subunit 4